MRCSPESAKEPAPIDIISTARIQMKKRTILALVPLAAIVLTHMASAQQLAALRIGYTDHEILISNMPEYRTVQEELQAEFETSQQELQAAYEDFQGQVERYQRQQALLAPERQQEREAELAQAQADIQEQATQSEQELAQREAELLSPIFTRVDAAIKKIAAEKSLDLVLRIQAGPMQPIILYANEDRILDITLDVAIELGIDVGEGDGG